ncbi:hypothetical protein E4N83_04535 [Treponema denticola]|uniref:hypothetical protein n=1 Tax=Treponema denticola TaxID=158 RepID=UPI0020A50361|nr:hypothetical protein [Treponema denticola]UTC97553.1 hypothetical protein E4N83_04535 [Treponema denticola]
MKKNKKTKIIKTIKTIKYSIFVIIIFIIGYISKPFFDFPYFYIDKTINAVELLSIFTTIFFGFILSSVLRKQEAQDKFEKEILLNLSREIIVGVENLRKQSIDGQIKYQIAAANIKSLNMKVKELFDFINLINMSLDNYDRKYFVSYLKNIRDAMTDSSIASAEVINAANISIKVRKNIIKYNKDKIKEIEDKIISFRNEIYKLQIIVNKY